MFVGRHEELNTPEKLYAKNTFQFDVMYGSLRVGNRRVSRRCGRISQLLQDCSQIIHKAMTLPMVPFRHSLRMCHNMEVKILFKPII